MVSLAKGIYEDGVAVGNAAALIEAMAEARAMEAEARVTEASVIKVAQSVITLINKRGIRIDEALESKGYDHTEWWAIVAKVEEMQAKPVE